MPIYMYRCEDCGYEFEKIRKISDISPIECTSCTSENIEKIIPKAVSFRLNGKGWFKDGYK